VVELHGLTSATRTRDLEAFAGQFTAEGGLRPTIKWAGDHSAAAVFVDPYQAREFLEGAAALSKAAGFPVRPYVDASEAVKELPPAALAPPKPRPKTTTAVAKRLIGAALSMRELRDPDAERELRNARLEKKTVRGVRQVQSAWDD
jgi:hypothetical protein